MVTIDKVELAWAAGFYEGEGSIGFHENRARKSKRGVVRVSITNTNIALLERFRRAIFDMGYICDFTKPKSPNHNQAYIWQTANFEEAQAIIAILWHQLSERRKDQAKKAFSRYHLYPPISPGSANKMKTHCPRDHEYTKENTRINGRGERICRECASFIVKRNKTASRLVERILANSN